MSKCICIGKDLTMHHDEKKVINFCVGKTITEFEYDSISFTDGSHIEITTNDIFPTTYSLYIKQEDTL